MQAKNALLRSAVGGQAFTLMTEGEKTFDITLRWPQRLRDSEDAILHIPVDVTNNTVTPGYVPSLQQTPLTGASAGVSTVGTAAAMPSLFGTALAANVNNMSSSPRLPLKDLVIPLDADGLPNPTDNLSALVRRRSTASRASA
jgi:cobalt-zinc-cadmium resistance protein CzcA